MNEKWRCLAEADVGQNKHHKEQDILWWKEMIRPDPKDSQIRPPTLFLLQNRRLVCRFIENFTFYCFFFLKFNQLFEQIMDFYPSFSQR